MPRIRQATSLAFLALAAPLAAQTFEWTTPNPTAPPSNRQGHAMVHDSVRQRTILFGGIPNQSGSAASLADTWEWNGTDWTLRTPAAAPTARNQHNMVFDSGRGRLVLFGGLSGTTSLGDTWEWNGTNWSQVTTANAPTPRHAHAMAYDRVRGRVVLFGGKDATTRSTQTWEYDGTNWIQRTPALAPTASQTAMVFHEDLGRTILFGGFDGTSHSNQTWQWDGTAWSLLPTPVAPAARTVQHLAYDSLRQRIVLFGGTNNFEGTTHFGDQWEHDGAGWVLRTPGRLPSARWQHALCFNGSANRVELFGGTTNWRVGSLGDTQECGSPQATLSWVPLQPAQQPEARDQHAIAYDTFRNRGVVIGGSPGSFTTTWEWDGTNWLARFPAASPTARQSHAMAYDSSRRKTVLFGGLVPGSGELADTWEWDGTNWSVRLSLSFPPARRLHAMAYDSARNRVVLHGGISTSGYLSDTWEWDGTNWVQRFPATVPPGRWGHRMDFEPSRQHILLVGGEVSSGSPFDTWTWDGSNWNQLVTPVSPCDRRGHGMAHDPDSGKTFVFGGTSTQGAGNLGDTWSWDGTGWTQLALTFSPQARRFTQMFHEAASRRIILFSGATESVYLPETWALGPIYSDPTLQSLGTGCGTQPLTLSALTARGPLIASQFLSRVSNVPQGLAFMALGFSSTSVGPLVLPFDLAGFGGTGGCTLYHDTAIDLASPCIPSTTGEATHTFTVPNLPSITGLPVFLQAWAPDSAFNALGLVTSNALRTTIGNN